MKITAWNTTVAEAVTQYGNKLIGVSAAGCTGAEDHKGQPIIKGGVICRVSKSTDVELWLEIEVAPQVRGEQTAIVECFETEQIALFWLMPEGGAA